MLKRILRLFFACLFVTFVYASPAFSCTSDEIDVLGDGTSCQTAKFSITTTSDATNLIFTMSAAGTFYVDCGADGTLSGTGVSDKTITRTDTNSADYTCTYSTGGVKTIKFGGTATEYSTSEYDAAIAFYKSSGGTQDKIASVSGNMSTMFQYVTVNAADGAQPRFYQTFRGCTGLTSVSDTLFANYTTGATRMFSYTFFDCTRLSGYIPPTTFAGLIANGSPTASSMWDYTFYGTALATSCSSGTEQYITGYEEKWGESNGNSSYNTNRVSCYTPCPLGQYGMDGTCAACSNSLPQHATWILSTTATCPWACDTGYELENGECVQVACDTFTVTTTNLSANTTMSFMLSAAGVFNVDWGDGSALETIDRTGDTGSATTYSHTYTNAGTYTIGLCGTATAYHVPDSSKDKPPLTDTTISFSTTSKDKIASIGGSLGAVFPTLGNGNSQQPRFYKTFQECTNLTNIPAELFTGVTGSATDMFRETFDRCSGITTIPANLFAGASGGNANMFRSIFNLCTSLTGIPDGLFANITNAGAGEFKYAFYGDTAMQSYIPSTAFAGLVANGSPTASNMWAEAFTGNNSLLTSCPPQTTQYITGYESEWNSKVSCKLTNPCTGATYFDSGNANADANGCVACPAGYDADLITQKTSASQCKISCAAGTFLATANDTTCTNAGDGYWAAGGLVAYGETSARTACPDGRLTGKNNAASASECLVNCTGTNYRNANNECVACPTGYTYNTTDGKTSATECQIECAAGYYLATANNSVCSVVGYGYYSTASAVVNYGSTSNRTQCTNPEETTDTETATSESECGLHCTGATYFDADLDECIACPTGYTAHMSPGKTSAAQCQIACAGGTYLATANDATCTNVGDGYWAAASTVNYGGTGTRTQCPNGGQTGVNNATSASQCVSWCTGTQYYDSTAGECVSCPTGYNANTDDGKTSVSQCQIACAAGTYVPEPVGNGYTRLEYVETTGANYINTGQIVSNLTNPLMSITMQYVTAAKKKQSGAVDNNINYKFGISNNGVFLCQAAGADMEVTFSSMDTNRHTFILDTENTRCSMDGEAKTITVDGLSSLNAPIMLGALGPGSGTPDSSRIGNVRFYEFKLMSNGELVMHLVPARNNTTNVVGMYDMVGGGFYPPSGTGALSTSQNLPTVGSCVNVGDGYYAAASTVNYGNYGTRNTCPNNTATGKDNAATIYDCNDVTECTGATYPNMTTGACTSCPTGYNADSTDGKDSVSQCKISCAAGTYLATANDATCTNVSGGYWAAGGLVAYGATSQQTACANKPEHSSYSGAGTSAACPWSCESGFTENNGVCESLVVDCAGATYLDNGECVACPAGYNYNTTSGKTSAAECQISCGVGTYIANAEDSVCTNVGAGFWGVGGVVNFGSSGTRTACESGLTTIGYGHGADEEKDCGRILHVGNWVFYARKNKVTTPSLNIKTSDNQMFYISASPTDHTLSPLHVGVSAEQKYTIYDDSLYYHERPVGN